MNMAIDLDIVPLHPTHHPHGQSHHPSHPPEDVRAVMIRERAYFLAAERGFCPGRELEDWLAAEQEVDALMCKAQIRRGFCG